MTTVQRINPEGTAAMSPVVAGAPDVGPLSDGHGAEVLDFLSAGSVDAIYMRGLVLDNGLVSPDNRGTFYGARGRGGRLEGVALVGHATLVEADTEAALEAFARLAQGLPDVHLLVGDPAKIERFWRHYGEGGQEPLLICRELLFEQRAPAPDAAPVPSLRPATRADLDLVASVNALMIYDESGVNPLARDPEGFRARLARRIGQGRVWVWTERGRLIFKADVMSETPEAVYLEGVYVRPDERGKGYGRRCLSQLGRALLARSGSVCLVVNEQNKGAQEFFFKAGYRLRGLYDSIFLEPRAAGRA